MDKTPIYILFVLIIVIIMIVVFNYYSQITTTLKQIHITSTRPIIISLTTSPKRLFNCLDNLKSMIDNGDITHEVHVNLPKVFKRNNTTYPKVVSPHPLIKIFTDIEDEGPATKILPTLDRFKNKDVLVISIDDDIGYKKSIFDTHIHFNNLYENKVITTMADMFDTSLRGKDVDLRIKLSKTVSCIPIKSSLISHKQSYFVEGFSTVGYPSQLMNTDKIRSLLNKTTKCRNSDDLIFSTYLCKNNIPIIKIGDWDIYTLFFLNLREIKKYGLKQDALHNIQSHIDKYLECFDILNE